MPRIQAAPSLPVTRFLGTCLLLIAAVAGCSTSPGKLDDYSRYDAVRTGLDPEVAKLLMSEFGISAESAIQTRIPLILESQTDVEVIDAVETFGTGFQAGLLRTAWRLQPIGAAFDSAVFLEQVRRFLETDTARTALGPALPAIKSLWGDVFKEFRRSIDEILKNPGDYPSLVAESADAMEITDVSLYRSSPIPAVATAATTSITDTLVAINDVDFTIGSLYTRMNVAIASIPEDIRRQIDRSVRTLMRESLVVNALVGLSRLGDGMKETAEALNGIDRRLGRMQDIILVDVDRQRVKTIEALKGEREIILEAVAAERAAILEAVTLERQAVMSELRAMVLDETSGGLAGVGLTANSAVDRVISGLQQTVMLAIAGFLLILVLAVAFRKSTRSS